MPTITYNVPANKQAEFVEAMRWKLNSPSFDAYAATIPELQAALETYVKRRIKDIYLQHKRHLFNETPQDLPLD